MLRKASCGFSTRYVAMSVALKAVCFNQVRGNPPRPRGGRAAWFDCAANDYYCAVTPDNLIRAAHFFSSDSIYNLKSLTEFGAGMDPCS